MIFVHALFVIDVIFLVVHEVFVRRFEVVVELNFAEKWIVYFVY